MAKRRGRRSGSGRSVQAAESIGSALGGVMAKVDAWMAQRAEIARELRQVADQMMRGDSPYPWGRKKQTYPLHTRLTASPAGGSPPGSSGRKAKKKRTMSAEARAKISAAQTARWARQKAAGGSARKARRSKSA